MNVKSGSVTEHGAQALRDPARQPDREVIRMRGKGLVILILIVILGALGSSAVYIVDEREKRSCSSLVKS